jgi:hypothetical protein
MTMKVLLGVGAGAAGMLMFLATCGEAGDPAHATETVEVACDQEYAYTQGANGSPFSITTTTWWGQVAQGSFDPTSDPWPKVVLCDFVYFAPEEACTEGFTCNGAGISPAAFGLKCTTTEPVLRENGFIVVCGVRTSQSNSGTVTESGQLAQRAYMIR